MMEGDVRVLEGEGWLFGYFFESNNDGTAIVRSAQIHNHLLSEIQHLVSRIDILFRSIYPALIWHKCGSNRLELLIFEDSRELGVGGGALDSDVEFTGIDQGFGGIRCET